MDGLMCGKRYASCSCIRSAGHPGPCACDCGGILDDNEVYALPVAKGSITCETVEAHVAAKATSMKAVDGLFHLMAAMGYTDFDEEDDDE